MAAVFSGTFLFEPEVHRPDLGKASIIKISAVTGTAYCNLFQRAGFFSAYASAWDKAPTEREVIKVPPFSRYFPGLRLVKLLNILENQL